MENLQSIKDSLDIENITEEDIDLIYSYIDIFLEEMSVEDIEFWEIVLNIVDKNHE
jgi:hypothetical protein